MLMILGEDIPMNQDQALKMAAPFGAGIARWGTVCGAVTGGAMAMGFYYGSFVGERKEKKEKIYAKVQEMLRAFEKDFKAIQCRDLTQLNLMNPDERKKWQETGGTQRCAEFVARNIEHVRRILKEK